MSYKRVLPRDYFNESKLLKCLGHLALQILNDRDKANGIEIEIFDNDGAPFNIQLSECGHLYEIYHPIKVGGEIVRMMTPYNSKANFPLICEHGIENYDVFTDQGEFTVEFINFAKICKQLQ